MSQDWPRLQTVSLPAGTFTSAATRQNNTGSEHRRAEIRLTIHKTETAGPRVEQESGQDPEGNQLLVRPEYVDDKQAT
jgi:hypothetical protein